MRWWPFRQEPIGLLYGTSVIITGASLREHSRTLTKSALDERPFRIRVPHGIHRRFLEQDITGQAYSIFATTCFAAFHTCASSPIEPHGHTTKACVIFDFDDNLVGHSTVPLASDGPKDTPTKTKTLRTRSRIAFGHGHRLLSS